MPTNLPRPTIDRVSPRSTRPGRLVEAVVHGAGFVDGASVLFSHPGIRVETLRYVSSGKLAVRLRVAEGATSGPADVTVINPGGARALARDAFLVAGPLYPWGLSLHAGWSNPTGAFGQSYDSDYSLGLDFEYRFSRYWTAELIAGYHVFDGVGTVSDTYWLNLSANLRYQFATPRWLFVHAGPGIYFPKTGSDEPGWQRGLGVMWNLKPWLLLEGTYDEHTILTSGPDVSFSTSWIGLKARF